MFDAIVIGGSYAGMSAAMQVGRARRKILVVDGGMRRNRLVHASHGLIGSDGRDPAAIAADGKRDLLRYPNITWKDGIATKASGTKGQFAITLASGESYEGKRLVLAYGVTDELPKIPGLAERWAKSIFHCPYCHGYELNAGKIAVIASSPMSVHHGEMLSDWGTTTYFTNGQFEPEHPDSMTKRGVTIERTPIESISGEGTLVVNLKDGRSLEFAGGFTAPKTRPSSDLAQQLGCEMEEGPMGPFIKTDPMMRETTVSGVFAAGDAAIAAGSLVFAIGEGARAGVATHRSLLFP